MIRKFECSEGFTLLELLVAVMLAAILTAIAIPTYNQQVMHGHRADAKTSLGDLANRMERYYRDNNTYATATIGAMASTDVLSSSASGQGYYTLSISSATASTYSVTAAPAGVQVKDTACGSYTLTSAGVESISGTSTVSQCW